MADAPNLDARQAQLALEKFDCSDNALHREANHVWIYVDLTTLSKPFDDPALRLRMSYHGAITIGSISSSGMLKNTRYTPQRLGQYVRVPDSLILPLEAADGEDVSAVLLGIENTWDVTNWNDLALVGLSEVQTKHTSAAMVYGLVVGVLITPLILTVLVYTVLRLNFLPYHFGMLVCALLYGLSWTGLIFALPVTIEPITRSVFNHMVIPFAFCFAALLTRALCGPENLAPAWSKALMICGFVTVITSAVLVSLAPNHAYYGAVIYHACFLPPLIAIVGSLIHGSLKGVRICQLQLLAWTPMMIYIAARIARGMGLIDSNFMLQHGLFPSILTEALLTSGVIGWQILKVRRERDKALHQQATLEDLATSDPLTGVLNRRAFISQFRQFQGAGVADHKHLSLMILDIDHFKRVNDEHGHSLGDEVLIQLSKILKAHCREDDMCARFGGEEFALLVATDTQLDADRFAGRLRSIVSDYVFPQALQVTVSIGLVQVSSDNEVSFRNWYEAADRALYAAKAGGRNRVQRSSWTPSTTSADHEAYAAKWQAKAS